MRETPLYPTVKRFLETAGFDVKCGLNCCNLIAVGDADLFRLTSVEMKLGLKLAVSQLGFPAARLSADRLPNRNASRSDIRLEGGTA